MIQLFHIDCMTKMAECSDKHFDLAIVDPPYGIGDFWKGGDTSAQVKIKKIRESENSWNNNTPEREYWEQLFRVSTNQIVWGYNYYTEYLGNSNSLIYWHKKMGSHTYSDGELAWTSFNHKVKTFVYALAIDNRNRTHPCQKPIALYKWLLKNYAKQGDKILDTHLGGGSSAIAAYDGGFDFVGCEIDKDYYDAALKRFETHKMQQTLQFV